METEENRRAKKRAITRSRSRNKRLRRERKWESQIEKEDEE